MRIKNCDIAEITIKEVGKFAILWNIFEKDYFLNGQFPIQQNGRELGSHAKAVMVAAKLRHTVDDEIIIRFATALRGRVDLYNFEDMPIKQYVNYNLVPNNSRGVRDDYKTQIQDFIINPTKNNFEGCLLAILQLRNNMFHGFKEYSELNNQIDLFEATNAVLKMVLG